MFHFYTPWKHQKTSGLLLILKSFSHKNVWLFKLGSSGVNIKLDIKMFWISWWSFMLFSTGADNSLFFLQVYQNTLNFFTIILRSPLLIPAIILLHHRKNSRSLLANTLILSVGLLWTILFVAHFHLKNNPTTLCYQFVRWIKISKRGVSDTQMYSSGLHLY